jgi:PHS family inorganic phosphate transporter-like MFS transporter
LNSRTLTKILAPRNVVVMLFGAYITKIWVPNPCDIDGRSRSLEELGRGKEARKQMEEEERDARRRSRARRNE